MSEVGRIEVGGGVVVAVDGDLTQQEVDAVVNAANVHLAHGGGVAAAIARAGGPDIQHESDAWVDEHGPLEEGEAAVTTGGQMPCSHVIHVAGPVYEPTADTNEPRLRAAVRAALETAVSVGAGSIAFPAISAGIYGYPPEEATTVLADEVVSFLREGDGELDEVRLVGYPSEVAQLFAAALDAAR